MFLLVLIIVLLVLATIGATIWYLIDWTTHVSMSKSHGSKFGYATFDKFITKFNEESQKVMDGGGNFSVDYNDSIFFDERGKYGSHKISLHAGMIKFDNIYMVLSWTEYWKYMIWKFKFLKDYKLAKEKSRMVEW